MQENSFRKEAAAEPAAASTFISYQLFAQVYAAAAFAEDQLMVLDSHVVINWGLMGLSEPADVQAAFSRFLKCLRDWLSQRRLPIAYIFSHESSARAGLHTHLAVHIRPWSPLGVDEGQDVRPEFRRWVRAWARRDADRPTPRAVRVRGTAKETPWLHWLFFHYLMKGVDPDEVVRWPRGSPDGHRILLGDLVAIGPRDPGHVPLKPQAGWSQTLGPERRARGVHPYWIYQGPRVQAMRAEFRIDPFDRSRTRVVYRVDPTVPRGFRSLLDDQVLDVRKLYGAEFFERVTHQAAFPPVFKPPPPELVRIDGPGTFRDR